MINISIRKALKKYNKLLSTLVDKYIRTVKANNSSLNIQCNGDLIITDGNLTATIPSCDIQLLAVDDIISMWDYIHVNPGDHKFYIKSIKYIVYWDSENKLLMRPGNKPQYFCYGDIHMLTKDMTEVDINILIETYITNNKDNRLQVFVKDGYNGLWTSGVLNKLYVYRSSDIRLFNNVNGLWKPVIL